MEFVVSNKNYEELNTIRIGIIESYLKTKVEYSTYDRLGTDTQLISIDVDEDIKPEEQKIIMNLMKNIQYCYKFLYIGYSLPIKQLKRMNDKYNKIKNYHNVYYYDPKDLNEELSEFAHTFISNFKVNYRHINLEEKQVESILGFEKLGLVVCNLVNKNSRLYLHIDDEQHLMDYNALSKFIKDKMKYSNYKPYYNIENNLDSENIVNLMVGKSPLSVYEPSENTNKHIFTLILSFCKICKIDNLPMLNCKDIIGFTRNISGFEYYTINILNDINKLFKTFKIDSYKEHEFSSMENALAFCIYLSGFGIKNTILANKILSKYVVCYVYDVLLDPYVDIDLMKKRVLDYYMERYMIQNEQMDGKNLSKMSIQELLSCVEVRKMLLFDKHDPVHINPLDNEPLPLSYYNEKYYKKYCLYNIGNIIKGIFSKPPYYDRHQLKIVEVEIVIDNGNIKIHDVVVAKDMIFEDNAKALRHIHKMWKKGYFLNSLGLMYYIETGQIVKQCIQCPEWFTLYNSTEKNLYKFLRFNDL